MPDISDDNTITLRLPADRYVTCRNCGISFVWTGWEQSQADGEPEHCPGCRHLRQLSGRRRGIVKWYDSRKGFGFITQGDGSEVFVHRNALQSGRSLRRGQVVAFRLQMTAAGPEAAEVQRLPAGEPQAEPAP